MARGNKKDLEKRLKAYRIALQKGLPVGADLPTPAAPSIAAELQRLSLPQFPYHRDPVATGVIIPSQAVCESCGQVRGALYRGPIYGPPGRLCPWCIADGSAHDKFDSIFIDATFGDAEYNPVTLPENFRRAVFGRTVGFSTNNPIIWWVHCDEPAEYITRDEPYDMIFGCRLCGQRQIIQDWD